MVPCTRTNPCRHTFFQQCRTSPYKDLRQAAGGLWRVRCQDLQVAASAVRHLVSSATTNRFGVRAEAHETSDQRCKSKLKDGAWARWLPASRHRRTSMPGVRCLPVAALAEAQPADRWSPLMCNENMGQTKRNLSCCPDTHQSHPLSPGAQVQSSQSLGK